MAPFNDLIYSTLGIVLSVPAPTIVNLNPIQSTTEYVPLYIEAPYFQESSQLNLTTYSINNNRDLIIHPKRNFMMRYESIAKSQWFAKSYKGKSLGEFIEVDY